MSASITAHLKKNKNGTYILTEADGSQEILTREQWDGRRKEKEKELPPEAKSKPKLKGR